MNKISFPNYFGKFSAIKENAYYPGSYDPKYDEKFKLIRILHNFAATLKNMTGNKLGAALVPNTFDLDCEYIRYDFIVFGVKTGKFEQLMNIVQVNNSIDIRWNFGKHELRTSDENELLEALREFCENDSLTKFILSMMEAS